MFSFATFSWIATKVKSILLHSLYSLHFPMMTLFHSLSYCTIHRGTEEGSGQAPHLSTWCTFHTLSCFILKGTWKVRFLPLLLRLRGIKELQRITQLVSKKASIWTNIPGTIKPRLCCYFKQHTFLIIQKILGWQRGGTTLSLLTLWFQSFSLQPSVLRFYKRDFDQEGTAKMRQSSPRPTV